MSETPVVLFVSFLALPVQEEALSRRLLALSRASLTEPGCLRYDVHQDLDAQTGSGSTSTGTAIEH